MKMMSSTSITSTNGVTLISAITGGAPPAAASTAAGRTCHVHRHDLDLTMRSSYRCSGPLIDLARQDGGELVGETFQPLRLPILGRNLL